MYCFFLLFQCLMCLNYSISIPFFVGAFQLSCYMSFKCVAFSCVCCRMDDNAGCFLFLSIHFYWNHNYFVNRCNGKMGWKYCPLMGLNCMTLCVTIDGTDIWCAKNSFEYIYSNATMSWNELKVSTLSVCVFCVLCFVFCVIKVYNL